MVIPFIKKRLVSIMICSILSLAKAIYCSAFFLILCVCEQRTLSDGRNCETYRILILVSRQPCRLSSDNIIIEMILTPGGAYNIKEKSRV